MSWLPHVLISEQSGRQTRFAEQAAIIGSLESYIHAGQVKKTVKPVFFKKMS